MQTILDYLKKKEYNVIDVTSSVYDNKTKQKYLKLIKEKKKIIVYIRRTDKNEQLFDPRALDTHHDKSNIIFYWTDKYFALYLPEKCDNKILRAFDMLLGDELTECKVCLEESRNIEICGNCFYNICRKCLYKTDGFSKKLKCPNCRKSSFPSLRDGDVYKGLMDMKELEKMGESCLRATQPLGARGIKPGQKVPIDEGRAVVFLTEEQMKEYGYL